MIVRGLRSRCAAGPHRRWRRPRRARPARAARPPRQSRRRTRGRTEADSSADRLPPLNPCRRIAASVLGARGAGTRRLALATRRARRPRPPPGNSRPLPRSDPAWTRAPHPSPYSPSPPWSSSPSPRHSPQPPSFWPSRSASFDRGSLAGGRGARRRSRPSPRCQAATRSSRRALSPALARLPCPGHPPFPRPPMVGAPTRPRVRARRLGELPASPAAPRFRRRSGEAVPRAPGFPRADVDDVPRIAPALIASVGVAPVGGRKRTPSVVRCRRSTVVAESLRQSSVPVAPGPIALPSPPAAPGARVEPAQPRWPCTVLPKTRLLQRIVHRRRAEQGIAADEAGEAPSSRLNSGVRRGEVGGRGGRGAACPRWATFVVHAILGAKVPCGQGGRPGPAFNASY